MVSRTPKTDPSKRPRTGAKIVQLRPRTLASKPPPRGELDPREVEQAFATMAARISAADDVTESHRQQLSVVQTLLGARAAFVLRHVPERDQLRVTSVRGRNDARITAAQVGEGAVGKAFRDLEVRREEGVVAVPLLGPAGAWGCLAVLGSRYRVSDELMTAFAAQLSAASEVARLRDDSVRRNKDLQTAVAGLKSLEKNREQLLSNVSHDLKTPLTSIKARLSLLGRSTEGLSDSQRHSVQVCDRNADRLLRMINDLLLISRLQSGKMELSDRPFGLKQLTEEVVQRMNPVAEPAGIRLSLDRANEVYVRGDRERIGDAVQHLVENAITHSPANSQVEIAIDGGDALLARLSVTDHGPGLEPEARDHVFDNFYRAPRSRSGGGLGLPIVARIVQLHGGRVEVRSEAGQGARFDVFLPLFAGAVQPTELREAPRPGGILLVEDDADCREVLQQVLEEEGYSVTSVSGAAAAMGILEHTRPAMVLLDLHLSQGDGRSVLHHLRGNPVLADVVVYIVSGASDVASLTAGKGVDRIDGYFEKPLQLPKLLDTVAAVVRPNATAEKR